jgi:MFS family permease
VKPIPAYITAWALAGIGAVLGSIVGNAAGKTGLFAGAVVGGLLGVAAAVVALTKLRWLSPENRTRALVGGMIGFAVAAPIAATNPHTPVTPVLICSLAGVGLLLGVWRARRRQSRKNRAHLETRSVSQGL